MREAQHWLVHGPLHLSNKQVDNIANGLVRQLQGGGGASLVSGVVSGAVAVGSLIAAILLCLALVALFVRDGRTIWNWLVDLLPASARPRAHEIGEISWETSPPTSAASRSSGSSTRCSSGWASFVWACRSSCR